MKEICQRKWLWWAAKRICKKTPLFWYVRAIKEQKQINWIICTNPQKWKVYDDKRTFSIFWMRLLLRSFLTEHILTTCIIPKEQFNWYVCLISGNQLSQISSAFCSLFGGLFSSLFSFLNSYNLILVAVSSEIIWYIG